MNKPMTLYADASDLCIGACLTQPCPEKDDPVPGIPEEVPIYFLSHKLTSTQQKWPVIEKEAFAIVYALQKLDYYLNVGEERNRERPVDTCGNHETSGQLGVLKL